MKTIKWCVGDGCIRSVDQLWSIHKATIFPGTVRFRLSRTDTTGIRTWDCLSLKDAQVLAGELTDGTSWFDKKDHNSGK